MAKFLPRKYTFAPTPPQRKQTHAHLKDLVSKLNPAFDHRNRLGIMCILMQNDRIEYNTLKELLDMTDGNLATHLKPLEAAAFIEVNKRFVNRRTQTTYAATELGRTAFYRHLEALEEIINHCDPED